MADPLPITDLIDRLQAHMPAAMRTRKQWLLWRFEPHPKKPDGKRLKVPYYVAGAKRTGTQGDERDRGRLATFEAALRRLAEAPPDGQAYDGLGFAFLPGDGLIGIDIDGAIDPDTGEVSDRCRAIIEACGSYTELSPSGKGVHIIVSGEAQTFKSNAIGLEIFSGRQYFTCTGARWSGTPDQVQPLDEAVLRRLKATVDAAKATGRTAAAAAPIPAPTDMRARLEDALRYVSADCHYEDWYHIGMGIKAALGDGGYALWDYWSSKGATYPGSTETRKKWESFRGLGITEAVVFKRATEAGWKPPRPPKLWLVRAEESDQASPARSDQDAAEADAASGPPLDDEGAPAPGPGGKGKGKGNAEKLRALKILLEQFALIYGTDTVWDGRLLEIMRVGALRLAWGNDVVKMWLASPDRRLLRRDQMVFEPSGQIPAGSVNLWDGFAVDPLPASEEDVQPIIDLLTHLCSESAPTSEGVMELVMWVLRWCAVQVQQPGIKLKTACVFHGPQGTGKNMFWDAIRALFGRYGVMVGQNEIEDKFNSWLSAKLFIVANEVMTRSELYHNKNKLKWVITEEEIPIRSMHQDVRWEANHAQLVFLSNEGQPVALDVGDRRHLVIYTPLASLDGLYARVRQFLDHEDGLRKLMGYLQSLHLGDFDPFGHAPMTEAKRTLIGLGMRPPERFMEEWLGGLLPLPVQVCSAEQLYRAFRRWADLNGERFPPPQREFTLSASRYVRETVGKDANGQREPPRLDYKVVSLKDPVNARKSVRCWLPRGTGPLPGISEGEWAWQGVEAFEVPLSRFGRRDALQEASE